MSDKSDHSFSNRLRDDLEGPCPCCYCRRPTVVPVARDAFVLLMVLGIIGVPWWAIGLIFVGVIAAEIWEAVNKPVGTRPVSHDFVATYLRDEVRRSFGEAVAGLDDKLGISRRGRKN